MTVSVVIPTVGRPSLWALLDRLSGVDSIYVVDDRRSAGGPLDVPAGVTIVDGPKAGPAAARNAGWRAATGDWIAFLDDDVLITDTWAADLKEDLEQPATVAGVHGIIEVPVDGPMSDRQADTAKLATAQWITADMAYRRTALVATGGFDERFPRAYREDVDLAYRITEGCGAIVSGRRRTVHPPREQSHWECLRAQRGNADDALLRRLYGPRWRERLNLRRGHLPEYAALVACAGLAAVRPWRVPALTAWLAGTAGFTLYRLRQAPGERDHLARLFTTSALIPPLAIGYRIAGRLRHRSVKPQRHNEFDQ
jgi:hypothetical protein